jgi:hypothetical protein
MNQHQLFFPLGLRRLSVLLLVLSAAKQRFGRRPSELYAQAFQSVASSYNHRAEKLQRSFILKRSSLPRSSSLSLPSPSQSYASRSGVSGGADAVSDEDEWYPHDPAWTTPQLLEGIWSQIAQAKDMVRGVRCFSVSSNVSKCKNLSIPDRKATSSMLSSSIACP